MKLLMLCLVFSTITNGYNKNGFYYLDLGLNKHHQEFDSFDFCNSNQVGVLKNWGNENAQFKTLWNSREETLNQNHLYDTFCNIYKKIGTEITSLISTLKNLEPGLEHVTLAQRAEVLMRLSNFMPVAATVSQALNVTVKQIIPYWFNKSGQFKSISQPSWYNIGGQVENWRNVSRYKESISTLEDQLSLWYSSAGLMECADNVLCRRQVGLSDSPLLQIADIQDLRTINDFCNNGNYEQAYQIVQKHEARFAEKAEDNFFQMAYAKDFRQQHDCYGFKKEYLSDPKIQTLGDLHERMTPSPHNEMLEKRYNAKQEFLRECSVTNPSPQLEAFVYDVLDCYMSNNFQGMLDKASQILNSSLELYSQLVDQKTGAFKFLKLNPLISKTQFPSSIHRSDNADLRMIVNKLGLVDASSSVTQSQVKQALEYVKHALNESNGASRYFAIRIADSLEKGIDDLVLHLPDFCSKLSDPVEDSLRGKVSEYIAGKLKNYYQSADIYIQKSVQAYHGMINGDSNAGILLEKTFGQTTQENILLIDVEQLKAKVIEVNEDFNTIFDRLAVAYRDVAANGLVRDEIYTQTDAATRLCLLERGINPLIYERFSGDQIQQVWHQLDVKALQVGGHLSLQAIPIGAKQILEFGLQSNIAVHTFVKAKDFWNAMNATCAAAVSYNLVLKGLNFAGSVLSETTIARLIRDPIGTVNGLIDSVRMVDAKIRDFSDFGHNVIHDPKKVEQQLAEQKAEMKALRASIYHTIQEKGIDGCAKELGVLVADHATLGWLFKTAKTASIVGINKTKPMLNFAENEVSIARTTAGTLEDLGKKAGAEINALKEVEQIGTKNTQSLKNGSLGLEKRHIKISSKVAEAAGPKLVKEFKECVRHNKDLEILKKITQEFKVPDTKFGRFEETIKNLPASKCIEVYEKADCFYEKMRNTSQDILKISNNLNLPKHIVEKIKNHLFIEEHRLKEGIMRFHSDPDIIDAWQRLIDGNFVKSDLVLLEHELIESSILKGKEVSARIGHDLTNEICNWNKSLSE